MNESLYGAGRTKITIIPDTSNSVDIMFGHDETVGDPPALVDIPDSVGQLQSLDKPPILVPQSETFLQCPNTPPVINCKIQEKLFAAVPSRPLRETT